MTALVAGIDLSARQLDAALVPLDADAAGFSVPCVWRCEALPALQEVGHARHARAVRTAVGNLLADVRTGSWFRHVTEGLEAPESHPVVQCWAEEPYTRFWGSAKALFPTFGAVLSSVPTRIEACEITVAEWRSTLGLPARLTKAQAVDEARHWWVDNGGVVGEAYAHGLFGDNAADALLVALAGRQLATRQAAA